MDEFRAVLHKVLDEFVDDFKRGITDAIEKTSSVVESKVQPVSTENIPKQPVAPRETPDAPEVSGVADTAPVMPSEVANTPIGVAPVPVVPNPAPGQAVVNTEQTAAVSPQEQ